MVEDLKAKLQEVLVAGEAPRLFSPSFTTYTICHKEDSTTGSGWTSGGLDSCIVAACHIQDLTTAVYKQVNCLFTQHITVSIHKYYACISAIFSYVVQHSMLEYSKQVFVEHLDKHPKYFFPETIKHALGDLNDLKPSACEVHIHHHGNENAMVVEGSNLWFCYQVFFRGQKLPILASDISGSSLQFNRVDVPMKSKVLSGKENVTLVSHFKSKPIPQDVEVHERVRLTVCA